MLATTLWSMVSCELAAGVACFISPCSTDPYTPFPTSGWGYSLPSLVLNLFQHPSLRAGHVDNFCCFISPGVVALAWPNDENDFNDPQWEISMDAYERLSNTTGQWAVPSVSR